MISKSSIQKERRLRGSSPKAIICPEISANGEWVKSLENDSHFSKYLPLDTVTIDNNSSSTIAFYPNQNVDKVIRILPNTIRTLSKEIIGGLYDYMIKELDGSVISTGEVLVSPALEEPTANNIVTKLVRKFPFIADF